MKLHAGYGVDPAWKIPANLKRPRSFRALPIPMLMLFLSFGAFCQLMKKDVSIEDAGGSKKHD